MAGDFREGGGDRHPLRLRAAARLRKLQTPGRLYLLGLASLASYFTGAMLSAQGTHRTLALVLSVIGALGLLAGGSIKRRADPRETNARPWLPAAAALVLVGIGAAIILTAGGGRHKPAAQTDFAFDSLYEDRRGESYANELVLARQMRLENKYEPLVSEPGKQSAQCIASPPPPITHRLVCSFVNEARELYPHHKAARTYYWKATVDVDTD